MSAPLVGPPRRDSEALRQTGYDQLQPTFGQSIGAAVGQAWDSNPVAAIDQIDEMDSALSTGPFGLQLPGFMRGEPRTPVTAEDWKASGDYRQGLSWFEGMTAEAAKLLAERHDTETRRADVLNRDPGGVLRTGALYAAQFATSAADPLGVLSSFIPIVGELRAARLAAQLGRFGGRAVTGLVEGAVGNALLEPLVYSAQQRYQLDYDMMDSLANIGMGGLFGGALHAGGGALADAIRARGSRAHVAAMDTAIVQAAAGREIDVTAVLRAEGGNGENVGPISPSRRADTVDLRTNQQDPISRAGPQRPADPADQLARDRATIKRGQEEDAARPRSFEERRKQALVDLEAAYPSRKVTLSTGGEVVRKGPMDLVTYLRVAGGIKDDAGELRAIDAASYNKGRSLPFAKGEQFLGRLVHDKGLSLEDAARKAAEAGYIGKPVEVDFAGGGRNVGTEHSVEQLMDALDQTLRATDMEGRVWGVDDDAPVREYIETSRAIDEEEHFQPARAEELVPLNDEGNGFETSDDLDTIDDPETLWREEMERDAAAKGAAAETEVEPAKPGAEKPLTPEQQVEQLTQHIEAGTKAAAACVARGLT